MKQDPVQVGCWRGQEGVEGGVHQRDCSQQAGDGKIDIEKTKHKHKTTLSMTNTQIQKFTSENLHNKLETVKKKKTHIAEIIPQVL